MANDVDGSWLEGASGLLPGLAAGVVCGTTALGQGPVVATAVAGLAALPLAVASVSVAVLCDGRGRGDGWIAPATAIALATPGLAVLGALLKANTHHRALAGVTFALVGLGVALGALAVGGRVRQLAAGASMVAPAMALAAAAMMAWMAWRLGGTMLLDAALLPLAVAGGWMASRWRSRSLGMAGLTLLIAMGAMGLVAGRTGTAARHIQERGLLLASVVTVPAGDLASGERGP